MKKKFIQVEGGITAPRGFKAAGVQAGIKQDKKDMALILSDVPAVIAGVLTTNQVQAASVQLCRERLSAHSARAIIVNSGNANACTGPQGMADTQAMAGKVAETLKLEPNMVFVCSTGKIGVPLPMDAVINGIQLSAAGLSETGGPDAAQAIMTTDTVPKQLAFKLEIDKKPVIVAGMAKGAGMICPNMATLLVFLTTDAAVNPDALQNCLSSAVETSFNRITVDGDQSTNDSVLFMANGVAGNTPLSDQHPDWKTFSDVVRELCRQLALMVVKDGEGVTKVVTLTVKTAGNKRAAEKVARAVGNSLLVKTSWYGADPNWGRLLCAVGYSGAPIKADMVDVYYDNQLVVYHGQSAKLPPETLRKIISNPEFTIDIDLNQGKASYTLYASDCSDKYVQINSAYMT